MWEFIDKIVYINLDKRSDRDEHMKQIISVFPSEKVSRFSAIEAIPGSVGCTKSHIAVMKMAIENNWKNILILEDDVIWNRFDEGYKQLEKLASQEYDVIHLGTSLPKYDINTLQLYSGNTTSSYLVNGSYLHKLLLNFEEGLELLLETNECDNYACDKYWQKLMSTDNWYACIPCLMHQKEYYSDIDLVIKTHQTTYQTWNINSNYVNVEIQGGLGNQLFQIAFLDYVSRVNSAIPLIENTKQVSTHTQISYFDTIFKNWKCSEKHDVKFDSIIYEQNLKPVDTKIDNQQNIKYFGYFQNYSYIFPTFVETLDFSCSLPMLEKYPNIEKCVFIHIRGGDYLTNSNIHKVDLSFYYTKAISMFPIDTKFVIFTNDKEYAESKEFLKNINYEYIEENEVDSLFLMSKCAGGICANSTFSWWGAYLNKNRKLILPSNWIIDNTRNTEGYYFKECISI